MFMVKNREWFLYPSLELGMIKIMDKDNIFINYVYINLTLV